MSELKVHGHVETPLNLAFDDFEKFPTEAQIHNAQTLGAKRPGQAVRLSAVLERCGPQPKADYIGLHAAADDFHASVPLAPLLDRAILIYAQDGKPLPLSAGGPYRLFIPDHSACHMSEIDECANVKFLDMIELTIGKGFDNRPVDEAQHRELHEREYESG